MNYFLVFASGLLTLSAAFPNCPRPADLNPCTCDGEGFSCRKAYDDISIMHALRAYAEERTVRSMYIQGTPLKRLSKGMFGQFKFGEFHIDVNNISVIESGVFDGSRDTVSIISLYRNELTNFPFKDIERLPKLDTLSLARNSLTAIPGPSAFGTHRSLTALILSSNKISKIGRRAFSGLLKLQILDLSDNKLVMLESQAFYMANHSPSFFQLALLNNSIASIATDAFGGTYPSQILLNNNRLTSIPEKPFLQLMTGNGRYMTIDVTGNPLTCRGCEQYRWIVNNRNALLNSVQGFICSDRRDLNSISLQSIGC